MRTTLFLSSLFAVTLFGNIALAEKISAERPVKEPRVVSVLRSRGDIVDKVYTDRGGRPASMQQGRAGAAPQRSSMKPQIDRISASRINCSDLGGDCKYQPTGKRPEAAARVDGGKGNIDKIKPPPGVISRVIGSDRMSCNEIGECSMGKAAVKRAWASAGGNTAGGKGGAVAADATGRLSAQRFATRARTDVDNARMSCNEAGECMMSSKTAQKIWAYESVRAGTWNGPANANKDKMADKIADKLDKSKK